MAKKKRIEPRTPKADQPKSIVRQNDYLKYLPLLLIPLFIIFYHKLLFGMAFLWEDILYQGYPNVNFAVSSLKEFRFPFWTPYIFGGMPFASDPQTIILYPPSWLLFLVSMISEPGGITYTWFILLHILLLGIGTYLLSIHLGFHRMASLFVAIAFMFSGYVSLHIMHTFVYVMAWFPFVFLFLDKAFNSGSIIHVLLAGLFYGISTLGGYPQYSMWCAYFLLFWSLFRAFEKSPRKWQAYAQHLVMFGITAGLGLAMAAIQYLPAFEHMAASVRETMTFEQSVQGSTPFSYLLTLLSPKFFGHVTGDRSAGSPFWAFEGQSHFFWETSLFCGLGTLFLALRAVIDIKINKRVLFLSILGFILMLLALGEHTPLYRVVFTIVPGFNKFRIPGRFAFFFSFCLILLAGIGMSKLIKRNEKKDRQYLIAVSVLAGVIALFSFLFLAGAFDTSSRYFAHEQVLSQSKNSVALTLGMTVVVMILLVGMIRTSQRGLLGFFLAMLVFIELYNYGSSFGGGTMNPKAFYRRFNLRPFKQELTQEKFRIQSRLYRGPGEGQMMLPRNLGNVEEIPLTEGYNQLRLTRYNELLYKVDIEPGQKLFNIRYRKMPDQFQFERLSTAPRFYLSTSYKVCSSIDDVISYINSDNFGVGKDIALEEEPAIAITPREDASGTVRLIEENPNRIELEVTADQPMLLSASEVYYPAWKASIDGKKTELYPANLLFRAIAVPEGTHRVVMKYQSSAFTKGMLLSLISLLFICVGIFGKRFLPKRLYEPWIF
ncbi:MAG: YfhO family protein [Chitinivibrionales bacterium]|nr:YfhO family protein [Chitinivibrionales bacterium]